MRCDKAERLLSDDLDGALHGARRARLDAHLAGCRACRGRLEGLLRLQAAVRASASTRPDPERMARSLSLIKAAIRRESPTASVRGRLWAGARWLPAGAAATLLAAVAGLYLIFLQPDPAIDLVPYAYSEAGSGLAVTLAEDENLAQAFESVIGAELAENSGRFAAAVESRAIDTGHFLDSLTDDEVLVLEAAIESQVAL